MLLLILKITIAWGSFALLYSLLLRHETFFKINRIYLIFTALAGIFLPIWTSWLAAGNSTGTAAVVLPQIQIGVQQMQNFESSPQFLGIGKMLFWAWLVGFALAAARFGWGVFQILKLVKNSPVERLSDGTRLVRIDRARLPFSFFHWIFISKNTPLDSFDARQMLAHERAHVAGLHSFDVVFFELLCCVFWFHPLAHWFKNATRAVHEYLADAACTRETHPKQYGLLLIRQVETGKSLAFANHFFSSQLKKRIVMLTKKSSSPARAGWKFCLVLPLLVGLGLLFQNTDLTAQTAVGTNNSTGAGIASGGGSSSGGSGQNVEIEADVAVEFPGGQEALIKFLVENIKYPTDARKAKAEGMVVVSFVVDKSGDVVNVQEKAFEKGERFESLVTEALRVVRSMPDWKPAEKDGKPMSTELCLPIKFKLD